MPNPNREIHTLSCFVHGVLAAFHTLGALYNARKNNGWQTVAHVAGLAFSTYGTVHHYHEAQYDQN